MENAKKELEDYLRIKKNIKKEEDKPLILLQNQILNKYLEKYNEVFVGIMKPNNSEIIVKYNSDMKIQNYDFIIPTNDNKLSNAISRLQNSDIELGISLYLKKIENIYTYIEKLNGTALKYF